MQARRCYRHAIALAEALAKVQSGRTRSRLAVLKPQKSHPVLWSGPLHMDHRSAEKVLGRQHWHYLTLDRRDEGYGYHRQGYRSHCRTVHDVDER